MSTTDQILDQLETLAKIEHALIVESLLVHAMLGHDIPPDPLVPGADVLGNGAVTAFGNATREMHHLHDVNRTVVRNGRAAQLDRAADLPGAIGSIVGSAGPAPVVKDVVDRERAIARAVDERYRGLGAMVVDSTDLDPDLVGDVMSLAGTDHGGAVTDLEAALRDVPRTAGVPVPGRAIADALDGSMLDLSDRWYALVLAIVDTWFNHEDELGGLLFGRSIAIMTDLNGVNQSVVERGLLPRFRLPDR